MPNDEASTTSDRSITLTAPPGISRTADRTMQSCSLKRKRPPKIEIPNVLRDISKEMLKPVSRDDSSNPGVCFSDAGVAVFALKGKKKFMEDAHKIVTCSDGKKGFFGVFDGHGGSKAAEYVAENLHSNIYEMLETFSLNAAAKEDAVKAAYLKTDQEFLKQGVSSGACCVTALVEGKEIIVSNLGDCRAVLCRGGVAEALTVDHKAEHEDERRRIEGKAGYVEHHRGAWRVHGILSVSRSIGDAHLKDWVVAEPDTKIMCMTPDMEYIVLASDGLWEVVGNQEAIDIVIESLLGEKNVKGTGDPSTVKDEKYGSATPSPSMKSWRGALVELKTMRAGSSCCGTKTDCSCKEMKDDFGCENDSRPSKARRISVMNQTKMKIQSPNQKSSGLKKNISPGGLVAACKELVDLAASRGSLDDITVMIVNLKHFKG